MKSCGEATFIFVQADDSDVLHGLHAIDVVKLDWFGDELINETVVLATPRVSRFEAGLEFENTDRISGANTSID